jgi:flagellar biosynthesis protein FlhB
MSWMNDEGKTEKPTPRRREKARSEGGVARSMELNSAAVLVASSLMMIWFGGRLFGGLQRIMTTILQNMGNVEITRDGLQGYLWEGMKALAVLLIPLFLVIGAVGIGVNVAQVGFRVTPKYAFPKWSRLNPATGFKRLFSAHALVDLVKSILKIVLVGGIVYLTIAANFGRIFSLGRVPIEGLGAEIGSLLGRVFFVASLSILGLGFLDYLFNRYEFEKSLKMTKDEMKEEMKQSEGDPHVKGKIREVMLKSVFRRMMKKLPEADVVITNPVHVAVALKYDRKRNSAPVVVAKGARKVAERIKDAAREHSIPIVENPPLARALYKMVDIGHEIPVELYKAVAEVLAYVYRLKRKLFAVA